MKNTYGLPSIIAAWGFVAVSSLAAGQPIVTTNPANQSVAAGSNASFTAAASGTPAPTVQWQVSTDGNGVTFNDIPGATSTTYTFVTDPVQNGNRYRAVFTNTGGSTASIDATLTLTGPLLVVHKSHAPGSFISGDTTNAARWYFTVSNSGPDPTTGSVNLVDYLPSGYTVVGPYGNHWNCGAASTTISCASSDTINSGSSFPILGLIVNVPPSQASVQNTASVSGGGMSGSVTSNTDTVTTGPAAYANPQLALQGPALVGTPTDPGGFQGNSVALSADGNTALVGSGSGGAWVWTRSGSTWTQQGPKLIGGGDSVALSGDGNTALVGAPHDNSNAGAVWVWTRSGGVWTQQGPKLVASDASGNAQQGTSVALSSDGNTALVGGPGDNGGIGAMWVWTRSGGVWSQQGLKLVGTGARGNAGQGNSVALSADGNTALIGGSGDHVFIGAAWVWVRSGGVWSQQGTKLAGTLAVGQADQGYSVALSADGNTAIVGGPGDTGGIGAVWVWTRNGGVWTQQGPKLVAWLAADSGTGGSGHSVALSADGNTALVGSPTINGFRGEAMVWARSGGVWTQQGPDLVGVSFNPLAQEGSSVALSADASTALVGAVEGGSGGTGRVFVFAAGAPIVTLNPADQTVNIGSSVTFTAAAIGNPAPTVQWQVAGSNSTFTDIPGATSTTYTFTPQSSGVYRAVFTNSIGSAASSVAVLTVTTPTLTILKTHSRDFFQGQQNATYRVLVNNASGSGSTYGTVTVTDTLPAGLTLVSMAGTGWTCPGTAANNCTRNDPLAPNSYYPSITVAVNVAPNAPAQASNQVMVSGGAAPAASWVDPTIIQPASSGGVTFPGIELQFPDGSIGVWYLSGTGRQLSITSFAFLAGPSSGIQLVNVADINNDGVPDLIVRFPDGSTGVWYMGGPQRTTITGFSFLSAPIAGWVPVSMADLNGDGHPDLIIQNNIDRSIGVWYLGGAQGNQIQSFAPISGPIPGWKMVGAADLDNDGHPDVILQYMDGSIGVWYMTGAQGNQIQSFALIAGSSTWSVVGTTDMDADGHPDLLIRNADGTLGIWFLGGVQGHQITGFTPLTTPGYTNWLELAAH